MTRLFIYSTHGVPGVGRSAIVSSLIAEPRELELQGEHIRVSCQEADIVGCNPFWIDDPATGHRHVRTRAPLEFFADARIPIEAVTASIFEEDSSLPISAIEKYNLDLQLKILEAGVRQQVSVELVDPLEPQFQLDCAHSDFAVLLSVPWLKHVVEQFRATESSEPFVIES